MRFRKLFALFILLFIALSAVLVKAETSYILSFDGIDDFVVYNGGYVVDDFEVDLSGWTVLTKTSDGISSVARDSTIKYTGEYSAKFDAYLDGIATSGYDWNDLRQGSPYNWSDCVGVGFLVYVPASSLGKNARLRVGFYDSDGEGWKNNVIDFRTLTQEGWYYVAVYKDEITGITGDGKIDWNNARLSIRIESTDVSLDGTTITVYIDRIEKIRYDLRNYTAVVGFMSNLMGTGNRQGILRMESYGGYRIRFFVNPDYIEFDRIRLTPSYAEYGNLMGGFEVGRYYVVAGSYDGSQGKLYVNGQLVGSTTGDMSFLGNLDGLKVSWRAADKYLDGKVLFVMLYRRALSDTEIQQIYENPNDPPRAGLILWYAPDSVDVANGKWNDKSGNGNDGTIVGATAERVSISKLYVYDANNSTLIPYMDVSVTLITNNTTTSLIPSLLVLPYNSSVTLNVSATNYESRLLTIMSTVSTISVYLKPLQTQTTETDLERPSLTFTNTPPSTITIDDHGFKGAKLGELFIQGKWSDVYKQFWYYDPVAEIALPILFSLGIIIAGFIYTRNPLVPIAVTAITMTFFHELGLSLSISLIAPLASLFVFFIVWTLWDFYKRFERS